jgi:hypothetical protein
MYPENCLQLLTPENLFASIPDCHSTRRAFMPEVAESIADANRFCDSAKGLAQNDSIAGGVEISNGNERRIQSCTCGANSTQLGLHFYALHEDRVYGGFSNKSHHIERRVT